MSRSKWKGPVLNLTVKNIKIKKNKTKTYTYASRNSRIFPKLINENIQVYNGKIYSEILIEKDMIGHEFGEFAFTRAKFIFKKKKKKSWRKR